MIALGLLLLAAYLLGATPTSYWVGKGVHGIDLRTQGSGNLGATNAFRVLGWRSALPVMLVDVAKGWVPVALFPGVLASLLTAGESGMLSGGGDRFLEPAAWAPAFGAAAILGHVFSFWVGFRGGKGVATSAGVFLALAPLPLLVAFLVWIGAVGLTRFVSLGSILAALALPVAVFALPHRGGSGVLIFTTALAAFVIWAHRANVRRLLRGEESRIGGKA